MTKKLTTSEYIITCQKKHGDRFDYSETSYNGYSNEISVICKTHGRFTSTAGNHREKKNGGCPGCAPTVYTTEIFIQKATEIHGNKFDYSKTTVIQNLRTATQDVIVICPIHGEFPTTADKHINQKCGCMQCALESLWDNKRLTFLEFIERATKIHGKKFSYNESQFIDARVPINITCLECGLVFPQQPHSHYSGCGCPRCNVASGGYSLTYFENNPNKKNTNAVFYIIEMEGNGEKFFKIGITKNNIKTRYKTEKTYKVTKIIQETKMSLFDAFMFEQDMIQNLRQNRYWPKTHFNGWTECFSSVEQNDREAQ